AAGRLLARDRFQRRARSERLLYRVRGVPRAVRVVRRPRQDPAVLRLAARAGAAAVGPFVHQLPRLVHRRRQCGGDQLPVPLCGEWREGAADPSAYHDLAGDRPLCPARGALAVHLSALRAFVRRRHADHQPQAGRRRMTDSARGALDEADLLVSRALIGGEWLQGAREPIAVEDPFTLSNFAEVPNLGAAETERAIAAAAEALPAWAARPARERGQILRRWFELLKAHREDIARLIVRENGKTLKEARGEFDYGAGFIEFYADEATRALGEIIPAPLPGRRMLAQREPVGVCAAITPWNFPLAMLTRKVGPALAAGCTIVAKPASQTPLTALAFAKLGEEAGVPGGVFNILTGSAREIGGALTGSSTVRKLSFTGSTEIGVQLYRDCAGTMKKLGLELGGNAPLLIFDDADLEVAVETALVAKFRNGGQSCIAANRIYVQDAIRDRFLAAFAEKVGGMRAGDGFDAASDVGPLIDAAAIEKVAEHREDAVSRGARSLA